MATNKKREGLHVSFASMPNIPLTADLIAWDDGDRPKGPGPVLAITVTPGQAKRLGLCVAWYDADVEAEGHAGEDLRDAGYNLPMAQA